MLMLRNYRELLVWQKAYQLCREVYQATGAFPKEERFGLQSQMRRAAVSVPSNIAEGYGRHSTASYVQSLLVAYGSLCELETQIMLAADLGYTKSADAELCREQIGHIERMLMALVKALRKKLKPLESSNPRILKS
jgi:four helix bundle protein